MEIYLIRHGQSKSNNDGTIQGQFDSPLSDLGIHQARLIREYLPKDYDMVYSSPLQRARDTALIALKIQIDHPKLEIVDNLKEIGLGELEGIHSSTLDFSKDQFREHAYLREDLFNGKFGAEKLVDFKSRAAEVFNKILKNSQNKKFNRILIFSHGGIMRA
ncbi:MAG: histidine phosphatase family protein, partial [Candidatus Heimdallarchaeota archaeon]|nr:histidine phosphatase family protein [Candidatus Heimdallarchaeota archaeon]